MMMRVEAVMKEMDMTRVETRMLPMTMMMMMMMVVAMVMAMMMLMELPVMMLLRPGLTLQLEV